MAERDVVGDVPTAEGSERASESYESPRLRLVGNLRDLLAGTGTVLCDGAGLEGNVLPANQCH